MQRVAMEELRQKEANLTALQAIGPRKKPKLDNLPSGIPSTPFQVSCIFVVHYAFFVQIFRTNGLGFYLDSKYKFWCFKYSKQASGKLELN
jgi:hypothetical protein